MLYLKATRDIIILHLRINNFGDDLQFLRYRVWQTEIGNYGSFLALLSPPLKTWKTRILKKWEICWRYHHFTNVYQKPQAYELQFLR